MNLKASELIKALENEISRHGDCIITCKAGDSYFPVIDTSFEDNEIMIECRD